MKSRLHYKGLAKGFTLLEVVIAMAFFSLAVGMLAQAANNALRALIISEEQQTRETDLLFMREQILKISDKETMEAGGDIETPLSGQVHWEATIYPTTAADLFIAMIVFEFPDAENLPQATVVQSLYLYRPSWATATERTTRMDDFEELLDQYRPVRKDDIQVND